MSSFSSFGSSRFSCMCKYTCDVNCSIPFVVCKCVGNESCDLCDFQHGFVSFEDIAVAQVFESPLSDVNSLCKNLDRVVSSFPSTVGVDIGRAVGNISEISDAIKKFTRGDVDNPITNLLVEIGMFIYDLICSIVEKSLVALPTLAMRFAKILGLCGWSVLEWMKDLFRVSAENQMQHDPDLDGVEVARAEGWEDFKVEDLSLGVLSVGLIGALTTNSLPGVASISRVAAICRVAECFPRICANMSGVMVKLVEVLPNVMSEWLYSHCPDAWFLDINDKAAEYLDWIKRVQKRDTLECRDNLILIPFCRRRSLLITSWGENWLKQVRQGVLLTLSCFVSLAKQ